MKLTSSQRTKRKVLDRRCARRRSHVENVLQHHNQSKRGDDRYITFFELIPVRRVGDVDATTLLAAVRFAHPANMLTTEKFLRHALATIHSPFARASFWPWCACR
jgi:hypothetical protein